MKENDIIKALECCILKEDCAEISCELCPYEINYECRETMFQDAINLIKHLKHENEILEAKHNCLAHLSIKSDSLINHQKAEIVRMQKTQDDIDNFARDLCKERMLKGKAIADFEDLQEYIRKEKSEAIREFAEELMFNLDGDIEAYANAGHGLNVYEWLYSYLRSKRAIKEECENG